VIVAGVDIGSSAAKAVILKDGQIISAGTIPTGAGSADTALRVMQKTLTTVNLSIEDIQCVVSTGYGRVNVPFAQTNMTEISCHARGIVYLLPKVRTILDMGGQDCKAIQCDDRGNVLKFAMNEKCAAGTGRYLERVAANS
jgi:benzoyl-CoA reductase subunit A